MNKIIRISASLCFCTISLFCGARNEVIETIAASDPRPLASTYYAYPYPEQLLPILTPAPQGYEPFHIEHYGRHGSRWLIGKYMYSRPVATLEIAERNGKLTPRGKELLAQLREIETASRGRDGELTPKGARQHRGIANRMYNNFPEVFADSAFVTARSTPVVRCIRSMNNELMELKSLNPMLRVTEDASYADLYYLNNETDTLVNHLRNKGYRYVQEYEKAHPYDYDFLDKIFTDSRFVSDSINAPTLLYDLFNIAVNTQSHDDQESLYDLFTPRELQQKWEVSDLNWFIFAGNTSMTDYGAPYIQTNLMRNIIASADTALVSPTKSANLRFGHEVVVIPMAVLMELDQFGREINDPEEVVTTWRDFEIFPKASNIQIIFYRPVGVETTPEDILVKVLLNEKERTLPVTAVEGPYYRWTDLRNYYLNKLENSPLEKIRNSKK